MSEVQFVLSRGVNVEQIGHEVLCRVPGIEQVVRLSGKPADVVRRLSAGEPFGEVEPEIMEQLVSLGVVDERGGSSLTRRRLLTATGVGAVAGISLLALPTAAAASSEALDYNVIGGALVGDNVTSLYVGLNTAFPVGTLGTLTWIGATGSPFPVVAANGHPFELDSDYPEVKTYFVVTVEISLPKQLFDDPWALWNLRFTVNGVTYNVGQSMREDGTVETF